MARTKQETALVAMNPKQAAMTEGMDDLLTSCLLEKTVGEICHTMEHSSNVRTFTACKIIIQAIQDLDIGLIGTIIKRVDGGVPRAEDRMSYANLIGDAIDDVLDMPKDEQQFIDFTNDSGIIGLAKAIVLCAIQPVGKNVSQKRERQVAADILLSRTGGLKNEPRKLTTNVKILDADWAQE